MSDITTEPNGILLGRTPPSLVAAQRMTTSAGLTPFNAQLATILGTTEPPGSSTGSVSSSSPVLSVVASSSHPMAIGTAHGGTLTTSRSQALTATSLHVPEMVPPPRTPSSETMVTVVASSRGSSQPVSADEATPASEAAADTEAESASDGHVAASLPNKAQGHRPTGKTCGRASGDGRSNDSGSSAGQGSLAALEPGLLVPAPTTCSFSTANKGLAEAHGDDEQKALDGSSDVTAAAASQPGSVSTSADVDPAAAVASLAMSVDGVQQTSATPATLSTPADLSEQPIAKPDIVGSSSASSRTASETQEGQSRRHGQDGAVSSLPAAPEVAATLVVDTAPPATATFDLSASAGTAADCAVMTGSSIDQPPAAVQVSLQVPVTMSGDVPMSSAPAQVGASLLTLTSQTDGSSRLALSLQPKELGSVQIQLDRGADGSVKIVVAASEPATLRSLMTNEAHLHATLDAASVPTGNRHLTFELSSASAATSDHMTPKPPAGHSEDTTPPRADSQSSADSSSFRSFNHQDKGQAQEDRSRSPAPGRDDIDDDIGQTSMSSALPASARMGAGRGARSGSINITA